MPQPVPASESQDEPAWVVHRQDDNGNCFVVAVGLSQPDAERLVTMYESRGHKQTYWMEAETRRVE